MSAADAASRRGRRRVFGGYEKGGFSVKREPDEDIKDYAETTMNELLGWYGYEKVDSRDTQGLNLTHFAASGAGAANAPSPPSSALEGSDASEDCTSSLRLLEDRRRDSDSPGLEASTTASDEVARQHQQMVSALSSITKHPDAPDSPNLPPGCIVCAWCQKMGMKLFTLKTPNGCKAFCSELCFTQCRRASFKKNKICDWCKHVRHTVNYVDFQDGEQQLQFCSDKCLNQYKMNIFCKETQAHLQMHTHLKEAACKLAAGSPASAAERSNAINLITPELWLRDCKQQVANGGGLSPNAVDVVIEDVTSDDNGSTATSPVVVAATSPRPKSRSPLPPPVKEAKKDSKSKPAKEREKMQRKHSKVASRRSESDSRAHHAKHKKAEMDPAPKEPPPLLSPPSTNRSALSSGSTPHLLSPPMGLPRAPPPPHHIPPQRHRCPPAPSPLNMAVEQQQRQQPFLAPGLVPPPFHFLAQQQMEAILRNQHELDLRSKVPPALSMPPWVMPPFHQASLPPPPPPFPPPPLTSRSPSVPRSSSSPEKHHSNHHPHHGNPKTNHHGKQRHRRPNAVSTSSAIPRENSNTLPASASAVVRPQSLLPPVTVMVPFPLVIPVPVPIPIPIPVPQKLFDKLQNRKQIPSKSGVVNEGANVIKSKRRTHDPSKHAPVKKRRHYKAHRAEASVRLGVLEDPLFTEARNTIVENSVVTDLAKSRRKLGSNLDQMYKAKISVGYLREYAALRGCFQTEEYPIYGPKRKRSDDHSVDVSFPDFSDVTLSGALNHVDLSNFDVISGSNVQNNSLPLVLEKSRNRSVPFNEMELVRERNGDGLLTSNVPPSADLANAPDVASDDHDEDRSSSDNRNSEERLRANTPPYDLVKKLVLKVSNSVNATDKLDRQALVTTTSTDDAARGTDTDKDSSRSVSPLSDMSGEESKQNDTNNNGDIDHYPRITFSPYNLSSRSSPVTSLVADVHVGLPNMAYTKSPLPENLMVHDRREPTESSEESSYFKRKCMRDNLSLMT